MRLDLDMGEAWRSVLNPRLTPTGEPAGVNVAKRFVSARSSCGARTSTRCPRKRRPSVAELVAGSLVLSHDALDDLDRGQSTRYLRARARASRRLGAPQRRRRLSAWIAREIACLPDSEDRAHLRAFATWQVQHDLQRRARRGQTTRSSHRLARTQIRTAAVLVCWLHGQGLALRDLRQEHLDAWLADGASTRRRLRDFISWAARGGLVGTLHVPALADHASSDPLDDDRRLGIVRRLLTDTDIDLRDRVAGCLLLNLRATNQPTRAAPHRRHRDGRHYGHDPLRRRAH